MTIATAVFWSLLMKLVKTFGRGKSVADVLIETLERRGAVNTARVEPVVRRILVEVRKNGDRALLKYAAEFDGLAKGQALLVCRDEMKAAWEETTPKLQAAMMVARGNILAFAEAQLPREWTISPSAGVKTGQIVRPLGSVGCYVPGGRYPLPLTLLMTVTPAQVAGVERIVVCSPKRAKQALGGQGCIFVTATVRDARELTNRLAPEHLTVDTTNDLKWVRNAGSVFVGSHSAQSMGDYVSGPNHVLPTGRVGRVRGGLSVADFVKVITVQEYTRKGLRRMGPHAIALAEAEGLTGHAESVRGRMRWGLLRK